MYSYDQWGWLTQDHNPERSTSIAPPQETDTLKANWTGLDWVLVEYVAPPVPVPPVPERVRILTHLQYMNRFTDAELVTIYTVAKTNVPVEVWLAKFNAASEINLDDPNTVAGLQTMEAAGLIGAGRAAEILA